jgi:methylthioribose-1-phosphate isomerase
MEHKMEVNGKHYRTIWVNPKNEKVIQIINQEYLPHKFVIEDLTSSEEVIRAIKEMHVRGAGLIGAATGYGMYLASLETSKKDLYSHLFETGKKLKSTRPTAISISLAVERQMKCGEKSSSERGNSFLATANKIADEDAEDCRKIGDYGLKIIKKIGNEKKGKKINILTHCNAGWLAFVDYGSALSPVYNAFNEHLPVHVWVDMTSPWNQGAKLTAWELEQQKVPYTIISDNTGGHLMQKGLVDLVLVGADRITRTGDVANKIGTYLKALSAKDNNIPFYVAAPYSTFDWKISKGKDIPIEERSPDEVKYTNGLTDKGTIERILLTPEYSNALNYGFDITPSRLITGIITEKGICKADKKSILKLFSGNK